MTSVTFHHHTRPQPHSLHSTSTPLDVSPTLSHDSVSSNSTATMPLSPTEQPPHPLYISTVPHSHSGQYHHSHGHTPYQTPSPPYSHPHDHPRSNSIDLASKQPPHLYSRHSYSTPSHRTHPYSPPPILPPLSRIPASPQSPDAHHYLPPPPHMSSNTNANHRDRDDRHYRTESPSSPNSPSSSGLSAPLSANDRRERNKAASAKYRAKKHYQSGEMKQQINVLQDQNNVLTRQLAESRAENASLKSMVEKLRGRLVAEKVLKRLREVGRERRGEGGSRSSRPKVSAQDLASDSDEDDFDDVEVEDVQDRRTNSRRRVEVDDDDDDL
ncbi:hypothetical protein BGZ93_009489 [Podila epicladia]|nr:hypothetical protein BGZ92_002877 [Podila epicladia]KAG0090120.1 hypothetical protein BGZ93_009489 [Podila epicladia]